MTINKTLLVIDGNSILNRAFYGIKLLSNKQGMYTNAITGFLNTYFMLKNEYNPKYTAVAFDLPAPTFRHLKYDGYKSNRKGMPDELAIQLPLVKKILLLMGVRIVEAEGYEADDVLGTLSLAADNAEIKCILATGDRDSFQLISKNTAVRLAATKESITYTEKEIEEKYALTPSQLIDLKALMGDASDCIPGVPGIGEKTALKIMYEGGSLDNIYQNIDNLPVSAGVKTKLAAGKDKAYLSRELAEINRYVPIDTNFDAYKTAEMTESMQTELSELLTELEMFGILKRIGLKPAVKRKETYDLTETDEQIASRLNINSDIIDVYYADSILHAWQNGIETEYNLNTQADTESVKVLLESGVPKRTFDLKSLLTVVMPKGITPENVVFDAVLCAYLLNVNLTEYSLDVLCTQYGITAENRGNSLSSLFLRLHSEIMVTDMYKLLTDVEIPLAEVLVSMEIAGVLIDKDGVTAFSEMLKKDIITTSKKIYELAGCEFNISSPKQLGEVLFEKLGLPTQKKTKSGYSTNADVLAKIIDKHPVIKEIAKYRLLTKLNSTYAEGLLKVIGNDGRIHSRFNQTETRTGRISSSEPNIQNIPIRTELGKKFRKFFIAKENHVLLDADYSQIELRVLAHIANDQNMIYAFKNGEDIHTVTAAKISGIHESMVSPEMRSAAKAVNFGIVYGISAYSLSQDINVSVPEAKRYINEYLHKYAGVKKYMNDIIESAKRDGYVTTIMKRRRYVPELTASSKIVQALGGRIAMNTPIQGTAADIIKVAMIKVYGRIKSEKLNAKLILQVHDELIIESDVSCAERVAAILREEMENVMSLSVPLVADIGTGKSWDDAH